MMLKSVISLISRVSVTAEGAKAGSFSGWSGGGGWSVRLFFTALQQSRQETDLLLFAILFSQCAHLAILRCQGNL